MRYNSWFVVIWKESLWTLQTRANRLNTQATVIFGRPSWNCLSLASASSCSHLVIKPVFFPLFQQLRKLETRPFFVLRSCHWAFGVHLQPDWQLLPTFSSALLILTFFLSLKLSHSLATWCTKHFNSKIL